MEDNKLTEFEPTELEKQILEAMWSSIVTQEDDRFSESLFISKLRKIMPPTCTPNQRKFLDRIKEIGYVSVSGVNLENETMLAILNKAMFPDVNLSELVEKKDE